MRGYYAKINMVRNKIRAMGAKNPCVIADPDEVEKSWDKGKKDDEVKEAATPGVVQKDGSMKIPVVPFKKKEGPKTGEQAPESKEGPKTKKPYPGYNPQKGVGSEYKP